MIASFSLEAKQPDDAQHFSLMGGMCATAISEKLSDDYLQTGIKLSINSLIKEKKKIEKLYRKKKHRQEIH
jgi:hypothetical protein